MKWRPSALQERRTTLPGATEFERVVLPHLDAAHNLARWLVGDAALAEDIVQDSAMRALSYFGSYRGGDARAWFLRIVRNLSYTALAARQRAGTTSLDGGADDEHPALQVPDPADDPETRLARGERVARLHQALAALPPELRECLVLRELEELSYKDLAHVTGVPVGTVMSRLWRARQALMNSQAEGLAP